jgi:rod shape-determining protein MreC
MKQSRRTLLTTIILVLVGLILIGLNSGFQPFRPEQVALGFTSGFQRAFSAVERGVVGTIRSVSELRRLREEYESLLRELEAYQRLEGNAETLTAENARLREQLGFAARMDEPVISARVIGKESGRLYTSFTINRGTRHGVRRGQAVIAYVGGRQGLVGSIDEVSSGTSLVLPVFSAGSYVAARLDRSRYDGLLEGTGQPDDPLILRYVDRRGRNEIQYDDLITTTGLQSLFPPDLPIGRVTRVTAPSYETSLRISVEPVIDFGKLEYVFILTNSGAEQ